jgi:hypothetical protein
MTTNACATVEEWPFQGHAKHIESRRALSPCGRFSFVGLVFPQAQAVGELERRKASVGRKISSYAPLKGRLRMAASAQHFLKESYDRTTR